MHFIILPFTHSGAGAHQVYFRSHIQHNSLLFENLTGWCAFFFLYSRIFQIKPSTNFIFNSFYFIKIEWNAFSRFYPLDIKVICVYVIYVWKCPFYAHKFSKQNQHKAMYAIVAWSKEHRHHSKRRPTGFHFYLYFIPSFLFVLKELQEKNLNEKVRVCELTENGKKIGVAWDGKW